LPSWLPLALAADKKSDLSESSAQELWGNVGIVARKSIVVDARRQRDFVQRED
jgi:hypothetical protein